MPVICLSVRAPLARAVLACLAAALVGGLVVGAGATAGSTKRRIPANFVYLGSVVAGRCNWGIGVEYPSVPKATSYSITYWDGYYHGYEQTGSAAPVGKTAGMTAGMNYAGITGGSGPAPCGTDPTEGGRFNKPPVAYANFDKPQDTGAIEGLITDKDGGEVEGVTVKAYGGGSHATAVSGPGGIFYMTVDAGRYRVVPDDPSVKASTFTPTSGSVSVAKGGSETTNFRIDSGLQVTLQLSQASVPADGYQIVKGTVTTTRFGRPAPGVGVELNVDETDPGAALTTAPKVAICGASGRVWPTGSITALDGKGVTVTTDANGRYDFTLTVGTVPGTWSLDAWGENPDGSLSSDVTNASDTKTLTVTPLTPAASLSGFLTELNALKSTSLGAQLNPDPATFSTMFSQLEAKGSSSGLSLGGLTFNVAAGPSGTVELIGLATDAPTISPTGEITPLGKVAGDLVIDPSEWSGAGLPSSVSNAASLQAVMQAGLIPSLPTLAQWASGAGVSGWKLAKNDLKDPQSGLQYFGWGYPQSVSGYCS